MTPYRSTEGTFTSAQGIGGGGTWTVPICNRVLRNLPLSYLLVQLNLFKSFTFFFFKPRFILLKSETIVKCFSGQCFTLPKRALFYVNSPLFAHMSFSYILYIIEDEYRKLVKLYWQEKPSTLRKTCLSVALSIADIKWFFPINNSCFRDERPANKLEVWTYLVYAETSISYSQCLLQRSVGAVRD